MSLSASVQHLPSRILKQPIVRVEHLMRQKMKPLSEEGKRKRREWSSASTTAHVSIPWYTTIIKSFFTLEDDPKTSLQLFSVSYGRDSVVGVFKHMSSANWNIYLTWYVVLRAMGDWWMIHVNNYVREDLTVGQSCAIKFVYFCL